MPQADPAAAAANTKKSPLDVLEDILQDAKQGKSGPGGQGGGSSNGSGGAQDDTPPEKSQEEILAEIAARGEERRVLEAEEIKGRIAAIEATKQSPQYLATQQQKQQSELEEQQEDAKMDGNQIQQLGHTKI